MSIRNKRLKKYIDTLAPSHIQQRASDCPVMEINLSPDGNSINSVVHGSSGIPYHVSFEGVLQGNISSNCSCPFDKGPVCKHIVSLAIDTESFFTEEETLLHITENTENKKRKYCSTLPFIAEWSKHNTPLEIIQKNSYAKHRDYFYEPDSIEIVAQRDNYIFLLIPEIQGWRWSDYKAYEVIVERKDDILSLLCDCDATNKKLCIHQVYALDFIHNYLETLFIPEEEKEKLKEAALNLYGFSLKDSNYSKYFDFVTKNGQYIASPKVAGIIPIDGTKEFEGIKEYFSNETLIVKDSLALKSTPKTKNKKSFGLIFSFYSNRNVDFKVIPVLGNTDKNNERFTSKIEVIKSEEIALKDNLEVSDAEYKILVQALKFNSILKQGKNAVDLQQSFIDFRKLLELTETPFLLFESNDYIDVDYTKISPRSLTKLEVSSTPVEISFKVEAEEYFYTLKTYYKLANGKKRKLTNLDDEDQFQHFIIDKNKLHPFASLMHSKTFFSFSQTPEIRVPKTGFEKFNQEIIIPISKNFEVTNTIKPQKLKKIASEDFKKQIYLSELDDHIVFKTVLEFNNHHYNLLSKENVVFTDNNIDFKLNRDLSFENRFFEEIISLHNNFKEQEPPFFYLPLEDFIENTWFLDAFEILKNLNVEVYGFDKLSTLKYNLNKPTINVETSSGIDWFDVNIEIAFGDQMVSLKDIRKSIINKNNYVQLKDGTLGILPEDWLKKYAYAFRAGEVNKENIRISKYQLSVIDSLYDEFETDSPLFKNHLSIKNKLGSFEEITTIKNPRGLKAKLRDYQKQGLNWLNFLDEYQFGGCLADDMGLGKTLQVISFLKHIKNTSKPTTASLIVLPTSLVFNWQEEINKFCPTLKYLIHSGSDRDKDCSLFNDYDIVLTSYGILARDISFLKHHIFHYVILDESQAIKNPSSQRYKAARLLQAHNRIVLTGTPIENNTFDLYAQMTFANPGLLGSLSNFKNDFSTPIDRDKNAEVANQLRDLIHPFLLRRTKEQVAKELPPKTEQVLYCTMEKEQKQLYNAYKNKYRDYLLNKIDEDGLGKSKLYVLEGLTKLRQICDSPQLLNDDENYTDESIKIKELISHIKEKTGNHKILVFSQFVKMLQLVKGKLDENGIQHEYLDGRTKNRQEKVTNFQENDEIRVFLISLKAGGTGLNLTAADYVYLIDPWWNPAVEAQAIDRCYRIGQTKKVMAYKMICKDSIEEKIIAYQEQKKQLSNDIIQTDESFVKHLSKETITDLFS